MSKRIVIIEDDNNNINTIGEKFNPIDGSWICPYCGKRVYSMEVHNCNLPYCSQRKPRL